jgi:hypothetical protein
MTYIYFADTWPEFMVGSQTVDIIGWISVAQDSATCGFHWNISDALHNCADIPVSLT